MKFHLILEDESTSSSDTAAIPDLSSSSPLPAPGPETLLHLENIELTKLRNKLLEGLEIERAFVSKFRSQIEAYRWDTYCNNDSPIPRRAFSQRKYLPIAICHIRGAWPF